MNSKAMIYEKGNLWQKKVYRLAEFPEGRGITSLGEFINGNSYKNLLTEEQSEYNFITTKIHKAVLDRFDHHKAGDKKRIFASSAASQPYCFNLVIYPEQHLYLAYQLFSNLLDKPVKVQHIEPEFTLNHCKAEGFKSVIENESIDDPANDIDKFYTNEKDKKGILLIEFKFNEAEFSNCSTFKNSNKIREVSKSVYYRKLIESDGKRNLHYVYKESGCLKCTIGR
jgi:hypothetical protein